MAKKEVILIVIVWIIIAIAIYLTFFYHPLCKDSDCWREKLEKCSRARYINDIPDITWKYTIKEARADKCIVIVEVLKIKQGLTKTKVMEGKTMDCSLPKGVFMIPETDPTICSGALKEEMQALIIEKLHQYILDNVGKIGEELNKITTTTGLNLTITTNSTNSSA